MNAWLKRSLLLVPILAVALFYVGMMYHKDSQTVNWGWSSFLGFLRCTVYAILAAVFMLPGCQGFDQSETHSKIIFVFDVSDSMLAVDDIDGALAGGASLNADAFVSIIEALA